MLNILTVFKPYNKNNLLSDLSFNRPFPSCFKRLFEKEAKCEAIDMEMIFSLTQIKVILTTEVVHLASF